MREIKYRGLSKNGWAYGLPYYSHGTGEWKISRSNGWQPSYNNPDEGESTEWINVDPKTIGQFTGLTDKNGKEIYEGDVIQVCNHIPEDGEDESFDVITFCGYKDGHFYLEDNSGGSWTRQLFHQRKRLKVIGNIFEHPELLTNKTK